MPETSKVLPVIELVEPRLRTASICLGVAYGSRDDPGGSSGLAHVIEHLLMSLPMTDGTSLCERVEQLGGVANAETGLEQMLFYAQVHARDAKEIATRLIDAVTVPRTDASVYEHERQVVLRELAAAGADDCDAVQDDVLSALFPDHPLGQPVGGTVSNVEALTLDAVLDERRDPFLGRDMALVLIGPDHLALEPGVREVPRSDHFSRQPSLPLVPLDRKPVVWSGEKYAWVESAA